jgi:hypothetical protein
MKDNDGCDNVWVIYDGIAGKDITQITFWDCEPNWTARTKAAARLITRYLNESAPLDSLIQALTEARKATAAASRRKK